MKRIYFLLFLISIVLLFMVLILGFRLNEQESKIRKLENKVYEYDSSIKKHKPHEPIYIE